MSDMHEHSHGHSHGHEHKHNHGEPAVFSRTFHIDLKKEIAGNDLASYLISWIDDLQQWVKTNKYLVGHIKVFIENGDNLNLWLSATGGKVSAKDSQNWQDSTLKHCTINVTAIIVGPDKQTLQAAAQERLDKRLQIIL